MVFEIDDDDDDDDDDPQYYVPLVKPHSQPSPVLVIPVFFHSNRLRAPVFRSMATPKCGNRGFQDIRQGALN